MKRADSLGIEAIRRKLRVVRRRLYWNRFLGLLFVDLLVALVVFVVYLGLERIVSVDVFLEDLAGAAVYDVDVLGVLLGAAFLSSTVRGLLLGRVTLERAALRVDEALGLRERISSALHLQRQADDAGAASGAVAASGADTAAGWKRLIEADGARSLEGVDWRGSFPVGLPRHAFVALAVVLLAVVLHLTLEDQDLLGWRSARIAAARMREEVEHELEDLTGSEEFLELEKLAEEAEDPEMKELLQELAKLRTPDRDPERAASREAEAPRDPKKEALVELNRIEDILRKQSAKGDLEKVGDFLAGMKSLENDPGRETADFRKALQDGDLAAAREALDQLTKELEGLQEKQKAGTLRREERDRLQRLSREMQSLAGRSGMLADLGKGLGGRSAKGLSPGDLSRMLQNLQRLKMDLTDLERLRRQMETLQQSLQLVELAKQSMGQMHQCPNCGKIRKGPLRPGGT